MRPIRLKIKGLNSFIEEQTIDFEKLTKRGFFGIFGPTGSGKSTILDGMILALYGMKSMSRGTNEFVNKNCKSAYVSYEFQISGKEIKRYRVEREFKANEKGTKSGKCKLLDITDGEFVLEESVSGVDRACAEIIGLTADDFMRTVVLPQGKFSEFLKVSGKERREILERLFRLEEYGIKLEERITNALKLENAERTRLLGQAEAYGEYSEELLHEKEILKKEKEKNLTQMEQCYQEKKAELTEMETVWELQKEGKTRKNQLQKLTDQQAEVERLKQRVLLAERADHVMPVLKSVKELEKRELDLKKQLQETKDDCQQWKATFDRYKAEYELAEKQKTEEEPALITGISQAEEAVEYWRELPGLLHQEAEKEKLRNDAAEQEKRLERQENQIAAKKAELEKQLEQLEADIHKKIITSEYRERMEKLTTISNELERLTEEFETKKTEWMQKKTLAAEYENAIKKLKNEESDMKGNAEVLYLELESLSESAEKIQILQLQKKLREGEPCPVCGSVHFELRKNESEADDENELHILERMESLKEMISAEEETLRQKQNEIQVKVKVLEMAADESACQEEKQKMLKELVREKKAAFLTELEHSGIENLEEEKERIRRMDAEYEKLDKMIRTQKEKLSGYDKKLKTIQENRVIQKNTETQLALDLAPLREKIAGKQEQIVKKIGEEKEPETYIKMLRKKLSVLQKSYIKAKEQKENAELQLRKSEEIRNSLEGQKKGNSEALEQAGVHLQEEMQRQKFTVREEVEEAILEETERQGYSDIIEMHARQLQETEVYLEEIRKKLNGRSVSEEQYQSCREGVNILEKKISEQKEMIVEIRQEIRRICETLEKQAELKKQMEVLEHKVAILEDLKSVTRGKRFVEFVAAERLRYISRSASKRLYEITNGSYELEINGEGEFIIRDNKNGGVLRQTATLSGGETFVTSLALALALSAEIQLKGTAPLELFFLDEGFGSLDEMLLDIVMESLEKIHNDQLKVGIISHVESVKTRVPVRLIVSPAETGISGSKVKIEYS